MQFSAQNAMGDLVLTLTRINPSHEDLGGGGGVRRRLGTDLENKKRVNKGKSK